MPCRRGRVSAEPPTRPGPADCARGLRAVGYLDLIDWRKWGDRRPPPPTAEGTSEG